MDSSINRTGNQLVDWSAARQSSPAISPDWSSPSHKPVGTLIAQSYPDQFNFGAAQLPGDREGPPPATEKGYIPAFLASNIGRYIRAEFVIGTNMYTDRVGKLISVGTNYFVLEDFLSHAQVMCDLYSVKFVTVMK